MQLVLVTGPTDTRAAARALAERLAGTGMKTLLTHAARSVTAVAGEPVEESAGLFSAELDARGTGRAGAVLDALGLDLDAAAWPGVADVAPALSLLDRTRTEGADVLVLDAGRPDDVARALAALDGSRALVAAALRTVAASAGGPPPASVPAWLRPLGGLLAASGPPARPGALPLLTALDDDLRAAAGLLRSAVVHLVGGDAADRAVLALHGLTVAAAHPAGAAPDDPLPSRPDGPVRVEAQDGGFTWTLTLGQVDTSTVTVSRRGDSLIVGLGFYRSLFALPAALCRCTVTGGSVRDGAVTVDFVPDPALWPGAGKDPA